MEDKEILEDDIEKECSEPEGIAMELLHDLKEHNERMDEHNKRLISVMKWVSVSFAVSVVAIVAAFLVYLWQYDFQSYSQDGGYNNINTGTQGDVNNGAEIPDEETEGR